MLRGIESDGSNERRLKERYREIMAQAVNTDKRWRERKMTVRKR